MPCLPDDHPAGGEQQDGVGERGVDRGAAEAPGVATGGGASCQAAGAPGQQQSDDVASVVAGIGHQCQRSAPKAAGGLDDDEERVEADACRHSPVELIGREAMRMAVAMRVTM